MEKKELYDSPESFKVPLNMGKVICGSNGTLDPVSITDAYGDEEDDLG